ncbi:efflux RND transporter permease subunit [Clostridium sp. PL3]|uniref:Efflux RND transporter permease subunit n=1 Tax=Clostridium thailandense TaxID=2794346 RepID=A0A949X3S5_9CLOT|nr:efflux RND transporter permease subunit [Clostridium thailandense]MBV7272838.1 efflux RND transporter permease subunit [Clostridium thailandense]
MKRFNLTKWCLNRKQLIYFLAFIIVAAGIFVYPKLGRNEDPEFTIREMYITVAWPGATASQVEQQLTDKIEKKLQDIPSKDYIKSYSMPGKAVIFIDLKDEVPTDKIRDTWVEVRNEINDMKGSLPSNIVGPNFNDRYDDVYGCIYALTSDGYTYEEMREKAENIRRTLLDVKDVKKVELIGVQTEKIFIQVENTKMAQLGITPNIIASTLQAQNSVIPAGMIQTSTDNVYLRVSGMFDDVNKISNLPIKAGGQTFRLGDIASITRSYSDPPDPKMFYNGKQAIGIAISMEQGGNVLSLGKNLDKTLLQIKKDLPLGLSIDQVANQPEAVTESINDFLETFVLALAIVMIVSFVSLGLRTGLVVAISIPLVIAGVFVAMYFSGIPLHKVSLGALIIALGLLVDDAIIAIEMMSVKLEEGWDRFKAGCFAFTSTAFPMLTGTLITCAAFTPVGFSKGSASEYTGSVFSVVTMALLFSWIISVCFVPVLGFDLIKIKDSKKKNDDVYDTKFYNIFRKILNWCLNHRKFVIVVTIISFCFSGYTLSHSVPKEFFPSATRPELLVDMTLPQGSSITATQEAANRLSESLKKDKDIVNYSYYVGMGSPRFVLSMEPVSQNTNVAQFVILTKNVAARERVSKSVQKLFDTSFENIQSHIKTIQNGPPSNYPVMIRVTGYDSDKVRQIAEKVRDTMAANPKLYNINFDWFEKTKVMSVKVDQDKARMLGIDSQQISAALQGQLSGSTLSQFRQNDKTVDIVLKMDSANSRDLGYVKNLNITLPSGGSVPLDQVAQISYNAEDGLIGRRDLKPTITVQAEVLPGTTGNDAATNIYNQLESFRNKLPFGYSIDIGGALERSQKGLAQVRMVVPFMITLIIVLLMFQLQNVPKMIMTLLTAPLGIIGVTLALVVFKSQMGFVVVLGILALMGIIIRNTVILVDQIGKHIKKGESIRDAIINSTILRFRPIMLTAVAAIMGMIPLITNSFWGPMAAAMSGGILIATILTLLVLPVIYAIWYKADKELGNQVILDNQEEYE